MRLLLSIGINPLGLAILETRGRVSGQPRRTPVGNGRTGDTFWIIAEHGAQAGYVRNIQRDPRVRLRLRMGWRFRWVPGIAEILPDDDALARRRRLIRWHPLRAFNAMNVRVFGTDLLTVRVQLPPGPQPTSPVPAETPCCGGSTMDVDQQVVAPTAGMPCSPAHRWSADYRVGRRCAATRAGRSA